MAGVAGDRIAGLRALSRPGAVVLAVSLVGAAVTGAIASGGSSRGVSLRVGGRPPPVSVAAQDGVASSLASMPSGGPGAAAQGAALTATAPSGGVGGAAPAAWPTGSTDGAVGTSYATEAGRPEPADAAPSRPPPAGPTPQPAPLVPRQPPGLGARPLPGLPPVLSKPSRPPPHRRPPPSGTTRYPSGSTGYDVSWPQCGQSYPPQPYTVAIVGVNDGQAFSTNPCLGSEASWAGSGLNLYININSPSSADGTDQSGPAGSCAPGDNACLAYNYGYNAAAGSVTMAANQGVAAPTWWLDVETAGRCASQFPTNGTGYWSCNTSLNATTVQGAIDGLRHAGLVAGDYSTSYQWGVITGGFVPSGASVPNWIAGADPSSTSSWCSGSHDFGGGHAWLLQLATSGPYDRDQAC